MSLETTSLDALRREIDEIDASLHDLLMRRAALAQEIARAKGDSRIFIRPGREARVLRRLFERHRGAFPKAGLVRIWRDIISGLTALQGPFSVAVFRAEGDCELATLARDSFGPLTPLTGFESTLGVLRAISEGKATLGILPLPQSDDLDPWWRYLARNEAERPRIVARLPFVADSPGAQALVIALAPQEESGDDRSVLLLETGDAVSRGTVVRWLEAQDLAVCEVKHWDESADQRLHLVEIDGYLASDDPRFAALEAMEPPVLRRLWSVGGYAKPLALRDT